MELAVNARDAMPTGGHLTLETRNVELDSHDALPEAERSAGPYVLLAVRDTGCGMDAVTQAQIFEPFFTTKPVGQGTGLGLAMVYGIITQSGGHIEVTSAVGRGTTFRIYLPRLPHDVPRPVVESGTLRLPRGTETIVLVEPEPRVRAWARRTLEACGYTVLEAGTEEEARRLVRQSRRFVHLLVTAVDVPRTSGRQRAAQGTVRGTNLKRLYLVDEGDDAGLRQRHGEGGVAVLQKPFTPAALAQKVREVLDSQGTP
jgi:CheY-like chemotaxis protein